MTIHISKHAFDRAEQRMSLRRDSFERLANKAYFEGRTHAECKGTLRKFVDGIWMEYKNCDSVRLFGEFVFLFTRRKKKEEVVLVTVYQIPVKMKKYLKT